MARGKVYFDMLFKATGWLSGKHGLITARTTPSLTDGFYIRSLQALLVSVRGFSGCSPKICMFRLARALNLPPGVSMTVCLSRVLT